MTIAFNKPTFIGHEKTHVLSAMQSAKLSGDGDFSNKCQAWFETKLNCNKALLTPSATAALEMVAILIDIQAGDEVIMPSYTFVSTANAFVLRGATIVFVDIDPFTMNIDSNLIESAITANTKAIVVVHYAGVSCDMDTIMQFANANNIYVIEDAAQGMMSTYKSKALGSIGHFGVYSFHETKNYTSGGEGGLLIINSAEFVEDAEIIREKGTNRSQFFRGQVDKYTWVSLGSSYLPCELQAAYLYAQLEHAESINQNRLITWNTYLQSLSNLKLNQSIQLQHIPTYCKHNAHMFYLKLHNIEQRTQFINYLKLHDIMAVFHYIPLHSSPAGKKYGRFHGTDKYTTQESEKLVRIPIFYNMQYSQIQKIIQTIFNFF